MEGTVGVLVQQLAEVFVSWDEVFDLTRNVGKKLGFVVVTTRSDYGSITKKEFLALGCEQGGKYNLYKFVLKRQGTRTRKCEYPFKLRARPRKDDTGWRVKVLHGEHNHERSETLFGHAYTSVTIRQMSMNVCHTLSPRGGFERNTTLDEVVGARQAEEGSIVVRSLLWAYLASTQFFNQFPTIVLIDRTYKTNKYKIHFLEMVGMTSIDMTFTIAFAYLSNEREPFTWR
ncbi:uncharacterized protein LOC130744891 [Lotus japonicus]|uniref:uncharacterized protein LOC130744891 n=1 Tax=Lotus japonicus TaxID=34305 RepID=UPI002588F9E7|nr:uncharacterized protein LOC130744891 [Lotus japonicus]